MNRLAPVVVPLAAALALGGPVPAADLLVEVGNPAAYQTLQDALDAAQPGDRILIKGLVVLEAPVIIRTSVTIESFDAQFADLLFVYGASHGNARLIIDALAPDIPLTFRRLLLHNECSSPLFFSPGIVTQNHVAGEVRLDEVEMSFGNCYSGLTGVYRRKLLDLDVNRVWLRRCRIVAEDAAPREGCPGGADPPVFDGASGVSVTADLLVMDDCSIRGGSAAPVFSGRCQYGELMVAGFGGFALRADCPHTILTRCTFSDGNGGYVQSGGWAKTPAPGQAIPSQFVRPGAVLDAFDVQHEQGLDGQVFMDFPGPGRGATISIGDLLAPLSVGGSGVLGERVTFDVAPFQHSAAALLIGHGWGLVPTPFGNALLDFTLPVVAVPVSKPSISFGVPNDVALVHLPVVSQLFYANDGWFFGNASGLEMRR